MPTDRKTPDFNRNPMLWLAAAFAVGIVVAHLGNVDAKVAMAASVTLAVAAVLSSSFSRPSSSGNQLKLELRTVLILAAFAAAGAASFQIETKNIAPTRVRSLYDSGAIPSGDPVEIEGTLAAAPEPAVEGSMLTLRTEAITHRNRTIDASGNVRLFVPQREISDSRFKFPNSRSEISDLKSETPNSGSEISNLKFEISDLKYGSLLKVACRLEREDEFSNPGVLPRREILDRMGVDAHGSIKSPLLIEHIADESVFYPLAWVNDQRAKVIETFRSNLSPQAAGVMIASLLGDKHFLDKQTADLFREGGTFHILVISGLHITFIGGFLLLFLKQFTRNRWLQFVITNSVLWAYSLAVGADVPVVRAAIMFSVISYSVLIYRRTSLLNSLGFSSLILLVWRPSDLFNSSFQLTFVSVAAILAMAYPMLENLRAIGRWMPSTKTPFPPNVPSWLRRFCELLYWNESAWKVEVKRQIWAANIFKSDVASGTVQKIGRYTFEGIFVSVVVQIWMLPLLVVYFHRVSFIAIILNLWVGFFIALESFAAVIGVLAGKLSGLLASPFYLLAEAFNWIMLLLPRLFVDLDWASFRLPAYEGQAQLIYFAYFIPVLLLAFGVYRWKPFDLKNKLSPRMIVSATTILLALAAIIIFHPFSTPRPDGRLRVDFLDVGQGDSTLITFPNGLTMLVDAGGRFDYRDDENDGDQFEPDVRGIGEAVVSEGLWAKGYSRIDHILATHAHADHIGGLNDVAKNFDIGSAIFGVTPGEDQEFLQLADTLSRRDINIQTASRGDVLRFGEATAEVLYPIQNSPTESDNDNSIVLRIIYGGRVFLLTGDIERNAEAQLAAESLLAADVVKVPHHGSRTSSTTNFVNAVNAKYAIISAPRRSPFGHPHAEVVERWRNSGANVLTTGTSGMISISTDGSDLEVGEYVKTEK